MTVTIELPPDIEAGLLAQAQAEGLALPEYVQNLVREQVTARIGVTATPGPAYKLSPEEWIREFRAWSQSPAHANLPVLSDEAMSREAISEERGL